MKEKKEKKRKENGTSLSRALQREFCIRTRPKICKFFPSIELCLKEVSSKEGLNHGFDPSLRKSSFKSLLVWSLCVGMCHESWVFFGSPLAIIFFLEIYI
jgi:hypothetical protein